MPEDRTPRLTPLQQLFSIFSPNQLNHHLSTLTMNSSPHIRSSMHNSPHAASSSSGKCPITIPSLHRHPTRRLLQHPEHNASLYGKPLWPAPPLPPHQFNMSDTDFYTQDL